jgi:hypothetical protein
MRFRLLPVVPVCLLLVAVLFARDHGERWSGHFGTLGGDPHEYRLPGTEGDRKATRYVAAELEKAGVLAAGRNGYLQPVKFRSRRILERYSSLALVRDGTERPLTLGEDVVVNMAVDPAPAVEAPLVFIGYGLTIPELHYDDLAGLDLHGKIAVVVSGGPSNIPGPLRALCQSNDERNRLLRQRAGVFGIVTIQNPKIQDLPWSRVAGNRLEAAMSPADPAFEQDDELELSVRFNPERAEKLFEGSGHNFKDLLAIADAGKPLPHFPLSASLRSRIAVERIEGQSQNIVGVVPGSDPNLRHEYVMLSTHLGGRTGAYAGDDASGVASLLDIAGALHESPPKLRRSLLFVFLTGEDRGRLGSDYFAQYPEVGDGKIVADLKVDRFLPLSRLDAITVYGLNESDLGAQIRAEGARRRLRIEDDPEPQWDISMRSDQYALIRRGVPAVTLRPGNHDGPVEKHQARTVADKSCASQFDSVVLGLAMMVANQTQRPQWLDVSYFKRFSR